MSDVVNNSKNSARNVWAKQRVYRLRNNIQWTFHEFIISY